MASPQKENGFTSIANELAEAFQRLHLSGNQWRLLWVILRLTYGWNKKTDYISLTTFEKCTGLNRWNFKQYLDDLFHREIIIRDNSGYITKYGLQKDYTKWKTSIKNDTSIKSDTATGIKNNTKTSIKNDTHKRQKTIKNTDMSSFDEFWKVYPSRNGRKLEKDESLKAFIRIRREEFENVVWAAKNYAESKDVQNGIGIRNPKRFLKDNYWKEWVDASRPKRFDEHGH